MSDEEGDSKPKGTKESIQENLVATYADQLALTLLTWDQITANNVQEFYKDKDHATYIWSITYVFYERLWALQKEADFTPESCKKYLLEWFQSSSSIKKVAKANCTDAEVLSRFVVAYALIAKDWMPPPLQCDRPELALDVPAFVVDVCTNLQATSGHIPRGDQATLAFVEAQMALITYSGAHSAPLQACTLLEPPPGFVMPNHSPAIKAGLKKAGKHTAHFTGITDAQAEQATYKGKKATIAEEPKPDQAQSMQMANMWQAIQTLQSAIAAGPQASSSSSMTTPMGQRLSMSAGLESPQDQINKEVLQVLQNLSKTSKSDKKQDCPSIWKKKVLPPLTALKVVEHNDKPDSTYAQRTYVKCAQVLTKIYELYDQDSSPDSDPDCIPESSQYFDVAVTATEALKAAAAVMGWDVKAKPSEKEQKKVFQAVMGADITPKELSQAYQKTGKGGYNSGDERSYRGRGGRNKRGRGRGGRNQDWRQEDKSQGGGKRSHSTSSKQSQH